MKSLTILLDVFAGVPIREAEVKNTFTRVERACAADAGTEAVNEPGNLFEWNEFENLYAMHVAQRPGRGNFRV